MATTNHTYAGSSPARAIDGDWGTLWNGGDFGSPGNPFWLQVDLQKSYKVDKIVLVFSHNSSTLGQTNVYNLYTSADGINWNLVNSGTLVDSLDPAVYVTTIPLTANQIIRYAKYEVVGGTHWANISEIEIWDDPTPPPSVNLASLHGVATTNQTYAGFSPARAIDGDWGSEWNGGNFGSPGNPFWLQVDLQKTYKVDKIVLVFSHNSPTLGQTNVYNLYTSADGINWNLVSPGLSSIPSILRFT